MDGKIEAAERVTEKTEHKFGEIELCFMSNDTGHFDGNE